MDKITDIVGQIDTWSDFIPYINIPTKIYKNRRPIQHLWKKLLAYSKLGHTNIVLIGRPSVGKSVLSNHLYRETAKFNYQLPETSVKVETNVLKIGDWAKIIRVIPGQSSTERSNGLFEALNEHKDLEGLIYVVDWGYTDIRDKTIKDFLINENGIDTITKLRKYNLSQELDDFKNVLQQVEISFAKYKIPKWVIIAVNKVDLFYDKIDNAQSYYHHESNSNFSKVIQKFQNNVGKNNIKILTLPICSYSINFKWNKKTIKTNIGGKDIENKLSYNFIKNIETITK